MSFPVAAWGPNNETAVIDVGRLFTTDIYRVQCATAAGRDGNGPDPVIHRTHIAVPAKHRGRGHRRPIHAIRYSGRCRRRSADPAAATVSRRECRREVRRVVLHHSMVKLPENPMMPRLFDERVGYFSTSNYGLWPRRAKGDTEDVYHPLAAREEGPECRDVRAGQADRLLHRLGNACEMAAVSDRWRRRLAEGV